MTDTRKLVAQRLKAQPAPSSHPDPDVLSAFAEKALRGREREQVLSHLSQCVDCREAMFLAAPATQSIQEAQPAPRHWLRWSALHWVAAAAACVAIVGTAVMLRQPRQKVNQELDVAARLATPQKPQEGAIQPSVIPPASQDGLKEPKQERARKETLKQAPAPKTKMAPMPEADSAATVLGGTFSRDDQAKSVDADQVASNKPAGPSEYRRLASIPPQAQSALAPAPVPATNSIAKADALSFKVPTANVAVQPGADAIALDDARQSENGLKDLAQPVSTRKKGEVATMAASGLRPAYAMGTLAKSPDIWPHWTLTSEGTLQRSVDAGKSWQAVSVPSNFTPRAVAAVGPHVWIGGGAGVVYHSSDLGENWAQVKPAAHGRVLTADVIRIEFSNTQNGVLTTSTGETWRTADGGLHWQRP